jgi:hypothetical protein
MGRVTMLSGEIHGFVPAFHYSAGNYTTLGSDKACSNRWRLIDPLEALDSMLLIGISAALLLAIIQRIKARTCFCVAH